MWKLIKALICGGDIARLTNTINQLKTQINQLQIQINDIAAKFQECQQKYQELERKYEEDCAYYEARIKTLTEQLLRGVKLPDLKPLIKNGITEVYPRQFLYKYAYDWETADLTYLSLDMDDWKRVLTAVKKTIIGTWTTDVFDCDDFALVMAAMVAYSSYKSGFSKQLAFGIAWSHVHAYNVFITKDEKIWVYEPQTNRIIGEANEIKKGKKSNYIYFTKEIWFMG